MRAVVQRVARARATPGGEIGQGLCVLLGVALADGEESAERLARRVLLLRIFEDEAGRLNHSLLDTGGEVLVVSQFTLLAETSRGNRPSFAQAAPAERAKQLYERFCETLRREGVTVASGVFGAHMLLELANDGPVTVVLDL